MHERMDARTSTWTSSALALALVLDCISTLSAAEIAPRFQWVLPTGTRTPGMGGGVAVDSAGQIYQTGATVAGAGIGDTTFTNPGLFLAKYSPSGQLLWVAQDCPYQLPTEDGNWYPQADPIGACIGQDAATNTYVLGLTRAGRFSLGGQTLTNRGGQSVFLAKFDPAGALLWAKALFWGTAINPAGLAVDSAGNSFLTAEVGEGVQTDSTNLPGPGVLAKCDPAGNLLWITSDSLVPSGYNCIAATPAGEIYLLGAAVDSQALVLSKLDGNGRLLWTRQPKHAWICGSNLAIDSCGNALFSGVYLHDAAFDSIQLTNSTDSVCPFLAKYDLAGNALWAQTLVEECQPQLLATDAAGNSYACPECYCHLTKFDPAGVPLWSKQIEGDLIITQFAADPVGNLLVSATLRNSATFDGQITRAVTPLTNSSSDFLLGKLETSTPPLLTPTHQGGSVAFSWPALADGFHIQSATDPTSPASWSNCPLAPVPFGLTNVVTLPIDADRKFFRLAR
jgi:hypothetical protein